MKNQPIRFYLRCVAVALLSLFSVLLNAQNRVSAPLYIASDGTMSDWSDLIITETGSITNDGSHYVNYHFTNNGSYGFTSGSTGGTTYFSGGSNALQTLSGTGTTGFNNVVFNNANHFNLYKDISVSKLATFTAGVVNEGTGSNPKGIVIFNNSATHTDVKDASHVNGRVRKIGNETFTFPVGNATYYRPASLATAPAAATDAFTAQYFSSNPQTIFGTNKAEELTAINDKEYWTIERTEGTSSPDITLTWDLNKTSDNLPTNLNRLVNSRWNSAATPNLWINEGQKSRTGNATAGSITSAATGYGAFTFASAANLWIGGTGGSLNLWNTPQNWKYNEVPASGEDIIFATNSNNNLPAKEDLHVPSADDKTIGDLINGSDKNLVVTPASKITIGGSAKQTSTGGIIVQSDIATAATGTLLFAKPEDNADLPATVEFYNKGYDCATCGFYTRKWQYFGIPVQQSPFPYSNPKVEIVNQWSEPTNGNKWITPAGDLTAFTGYEITNSTTTEPTNKYSFTGKLNLTDASVAFTKTDGVNYQGMNLVANSYTAAIPIKEEALQFSSPLANKTVYLFNAGTRDQWRKLNGSTVTHNTQSGQYKAVPINVAGAAGLPDIIPSMHTFMLQADAGSTLTIKYEQLVKNATVDGMAWRSSSVNIASPRREYPYLVMDVIGAQSADRVWLFENPSTTRGFDNGWDGVKLPEAGIAQLSVKGDKGDDYQVATVPEMEGTSFGFAAPADGAYVLNINVSTDIAARNLYLLDTKTRKTWALDGRVGEFTFTAMKGENSARFAIIDKQQVSENSITLLKVYYRNKSIVVNNGSDEDCTVSVYDIGGRLALQQQVKRQSIATLHNSGALPYGVYVVKAAGKTVNEVKRVMVD